MRAGGVYGESYAIKAIVFLVAAGLHLAIAVPYLTERENLGTTESPIISVQVNLQETKFLAPENPGKNTVIIPEQNQMQPMVKAELPLPKEPQEAEKADRVRQNAEEPRKAPPIPLRKPIIKISESSPKKETPPKEQKVTETAQSPETPAPPSKEGDDDKKRQAESATASAVSMGQRQASPKQQENYAARLQRHIAGHLPEGEGLSGRTVIVFTLAPDGGLLRLQVSKPSQDSKLDQLALDTIKNAAPYPRPPANSTTLQRTFSIPFDFRKIQ